MPKSPVPRGVAGQIKMRGKKEKHLSCKCCTMLDLRQYVHDKETTKEMKLFTIEEPTNREEESSIEQSCTDKDPSHLTRTTYPQCRHAMSCCYNHASREQQISYMILCPECGNKRCPKATDCTLSCTSSNEPGQEGSRYQ